MNWFRTDDQGNFIWPGFGENMRVLEWIVGRVKGSAHAVETPLGFQPAPEDISIEGLNLSKEKLTDLLTVQADEWKDELASQKEFLGEIGSKLPQEIREEHDRLKTRLGI